MWTTRRLLARLDDLATMVRAVVTGWPETREAVHQIRRALAAIEADRRTSHRLAEEVAAHAQTREALAALRATQAWLHEHVNRLEADRQALLARVLQVQVPAMHLSVAPEPTPTPQGSPEDQDAYASTIPALQAVGSLFEDVGDEAAAELGVGHDEHGNVIWRR